MRAFPTKHFLVVGVLQTALLGAIVGAMLGGVSLAVMLGDGSVGAIFGFVLGGAFGAIGSVPAYRVFKGRNVRDCQAMIATITFLLGFPLAVGQWTNPFLLYLGTMGAFFASLGMCIWLIPRTPPKHGPDTLDT